MRQFASNCVNTHQFEEIWVNYYDYKPVGSDEKPNLIFGKRESVMDGEGKRLFSILWKEFLKGGFNQKTKKKLNWMARKIRNIYIES